MTEVLLKNPGFVPNGPDGMSCLHACVQMVMRAKPNGHVFTFEEIDKILRRKPGLYSWEYAIYSALGSEGFDVKYVRQFSIERLARDGESYLLEYYGPEAGKVQIKNSDMPIIREDAGNFLKSNRIDFQERIPSLEDVRASIKNGWYVVPEVNCRVLDSRPGYAGHFVFVYGFNDDDVMLHDPGKLDGTPRDGRRVSWSVFEKAWSSPNEAARAMGCFLPQGLHL